MEAKLVPTQKAVVNTGAHQRTINVGVLDIDEMHEDLAQHVADEIKKNLE